VHANAASGLKFNDVGGGAPRPRAIFRGGLSPANDAPVRDTFKSLFSFE
jgi:hypothetical protein